MFYLFLELSLRNQCVFSTHSTTQFKLTTFKCSIAPDDQWLATLWAADNSYDWGTECEEYKQRKEASNA